MTDKELGIEVQSLIDVQADLVEACEMAPADFQHSCEPCNFVTIDALERAIVKVKPEMRAVFDKT